MYKNDLCKRNLQAVYDFWFVTSPVTSGFIMQTPLYKMSSIKEIKYFTWSHSTFLNLLSSQINTTLKTCMKNLWYYGLTNIKNMCVLLKQPSCKYSRAANKHKYCILFWSSKLNNKNHTYYKKTASFTSTSEADNRSYCMITFGSGRGSLRILQTMTMMIPPPMPATKTRAATKPVMVNLSSFSAVGLSMVLVSKLWETLTFVFLLSALGGSKHKLASQQHNSCVLLSTFDC